MFEDYYLLLQTTRYQTEEELRKSIESLKGRDDYYSVKRLEALSASRQQWRVKDALFGQPLELRAAPAQRLPNRRAKRLPRTAHRRDPVFDPALGRVQLAASIAIAMATGPVA